MAVTASAGASRYGVRRSERAIGFELVLQLGPDSALHKTTDGPEQRAEHPRPALRVHLPVPAHHRALALGGKGQRPGGLHHRTGRARTKPARPVERGQLHQHLGACPAHACTEPRPQPDRQRSEQLDTSHGWVERRLVTRVGNRVKYLLDRRRDADMTGDVGHGSTVLGALLTGAYGTTASARSPRTPNGCKEAYVLRSRLLGKARRSVPAFCVGSDRQSRASGRHPTDPVSRQAHAPGGRVVLVRPGRRSASDFTIRSVSRRISALNGPTSSQ